MLKLELVDRSDILRLTYGLTGTISNINFLLQTTRVGQWCVSDCQVDEEEIITKLTSGF